MKSRIWFLVFIFTLLGAPALLACEDCIPKGALDPNGSGPYSSAICWSRDSGVWSWCVGGSVVCSGGNYGSDCPVPGSGGGSECGDHCVQNPTLRSREAAQTCKSVDLSGRCAGERRNRSIPTL